MWAQENPLGQVRIAAFRQGRNGKNISQLTNKPPSSNDANGTFAKEINEMA
jgi:hypothetical protein